MNEDKGKNEKNILLTKDYILNEYLLQKKVLIFLLVFLWIVTAILGILFQFRYHTLLSNWTVFLAFLFWPAFLSLLDLVYLVKQQLSIHNIVTYGIKITDDVIYKKREIQKKEHDVFELFLVDFGRVRIEESIFKKANIYDAVYLVKILNKKGTAKDPLVFFRRETMLSPELEMHHIKSYLSEEDNKKRADQCSYNSNYYCKKEDFTNLICNDRCQEVN